MVQEMHPPPVPESYALQGHVHLLDHAVPGHEHDHAALGHTHLADDTDWALIPTSGSATPYSTGLSSAWTPRYRRINGIVYLQGLINAGATTNPNTIATLPVGFRPRSTVMEAIRNSVGFRRLDIGANGALILREGNITSSWNSVQLTYPADN